MSDQQSFLSGDPYSRYQASERMLNTAITQAKISESFEDTVVVSGAARGGKSFHFVLTLTGSSIAVLLTLTPASPYGRFWMGVHNGYHLARLCRSPQCCRSQTPAWSIPHH